MIRIGTFVKQSRNIGDITVDIFGNVSNIEKIKSKKVNSDGLEESDLYEITFEPNFNDVDDDTIQYLIRMKNSPIGKNMKFYFLSNDLQSAIGAEII
jgi:hypothetical protein